MKSAALFGGSFDPPHIGHIMIVDKLKELEGIEKIVVMPTYLNPFKKGFHASPTKRLEWLKKLFRNDDKVIVSDYEVRQNKPVATIETLQELKKRYDKVYIVIGADNLDALPTWHDYETLKKEAQFIVVTRPGYTLKGDWKTIPLTVDISSSALRSNMQKEFLPQPIADEIIHHYKEKNENENR